MMSFAVLCYGFYSAVIAFRHERNFTRILFFRNQLLNKSLCVPCTVKKEYQFILELFVHQKPVRIGDCLMNMKDIIDIVEKKGVEISREEALREVLKRLIARGMPPGEALVIVDLPEENKT